MFVDTRFTRVRQILGKAPVPGVGSKLLALLKVEAVMKPHGIERNLAAFLYADVAGHSRLTRADEEGTHRTLSTYLDAVTAFIERWKSDEQMLLRAHICWGAAAGPFSGPWKRVMP